MLPKGRIKHEVSDSPKIVETGSVSRLEQLSGGRPRLCPSARCDHGSRRTERVERPRRRPSNCRRNTSCHECSQKLRGGRPRLCLASLGLDEPPGKTLVKIGGSIGTKFFDHVWHNVAHSILTLNSAAIERLISGILFQGNKDCRPSTLKLSIGGFEEIWCWWCFIFQHGIGI